MNIRDSIAAQVRGLYRSQSAKARELAAIKQQMDHERKPGLLPTDRRVRRAKERIQAASLRKEHQRGRRAHEKALQVDDVTAGMTRIMLGEYNPQRVSPALVRNVELTAARRAKIDISDEHPDWSGSQIDAAVAKRFNDMGLEGDRLATLEYQEVAV